MAERLGRVAGGWWLKAWGVGREAWGVGRDAWGERTVVRGSRVEGRKITLHAPRPALCRTPFIELEGAIRLCSRMLKSRGTTMRTV
jgi:hypothetical protein